jgi:hypothetical protein
MLRQNRSSIPRLPLVICIESGGNLSLYHFLNGFWKAFHESLFVVYDFFASLFEELDVCVLPFSGVEHCVA